MNIVKIKGYASAIVGIIFLTYVVIFLSETGFSMINGVINRDEYIIFDPKDMPLMLCIPVVIYFEVICICVLLPYKIKTSAFLQKLMVPVTAYGIVAFAVGIIISIIISFYPLGTDYIKCHSTSIVSSGSSYAKSKEICKQRGSDGY